MEERLFDGIWWLPNSPERTVGGRFSFRKEVGARLEVLGELLQPEERAATTGKVPIVLGSISTTEITLLDVNIGPAPFALARRYVQQEFRPELVVVGVHLASRDELRSARWQMRFSQLEEWLEARGFSTEEGWDTRRGADSDFLSRHIPTDGSTGH